MKEEGHGRREIHLILDAEEKHFVKDFHASPARPSNSNNTEVYGC
jgi:hypothetical protein